MKQRKYEEALEVFEESIKRGKDGKYPIWNKCEALKKLGRYLEAIEVIQKNTTKGKLSKWAQDEIAKLRALTEAQKKGETKVEEETTEDEEEETVGALEEEEIPEEEIRIDRVAKQAKQTPTEKILEELILQKIERGQTVFGRKLKVYDSEEKAMVNSSPLLVWDE